ncbi:MAG: SDR family oxidoreductase [Actinomycetota bacterium]
MSVESDPPASPDQTPDRAPGPQPGAVAWQRALVTGASSGIGRAFARLLAERGTDLVITARDRGRLEALAAELGEGSADAGGSGRGVDVEIVVADLADRQHLDVLVDRLGAEQSPVDLLVNNAGFGFSGDFISLDRDDETAVVDVNIVALHRLAHAAGTAMSARGRGGILNVSSIAGWGPAPRAATYAATKAFVTSFSEALHVELGPQGVAVSCLCPGLTRTEFQDRAGSDTSRTPDFLWQSAEAVADAGLAGLDRGRAVVVPGAHNKILSAGIGLAPITLIDRVRRRFR